MAFCSVKCDILRSERVHRVAETEYQAVLGGIYLIEGHMCPSVQPDKVIQLPDIRRQMHE